MNPTKVILSSAIRCSVAFKGFMLLQIILQIGITLAIKIDQFQLCLILNNYIAAHIADYLHLSPVGLHIIGLTVSLLDLIDSQPQINKLMVLSDPRRLSAIFFNESVRYFFLKNHTIKIVIQGVNNHLIS